MSGEHGLIFLVDPEYSKCYFEIFGRPDFGIELQPKYFFSDLFLPTDSLIRMYGIDLIELEKFKSKLLAAVMGASLVEISTRSGTEIAIQPRSWFSTEVGEIYTAPKEYTAEGKIVVDGCAYTGPPKEVFTLELKDGRVVNIDLLNKDDSQQQWVMGDLTRDQNANALAEFGIGINPGALWYAELMEAECALGTCHFGFGHNIAYGGRNKSAYHVDYVVREPTIIVDGKTICAAGKYVF